MRPSRVGVAGDTAGRGGDVDELDERGDDDGGQRRLGQLLEQAGEEEQGDDRERGDDQPGRSGTSRRRRR